MSHLSITQLAELTGRERRTVTKLVEKLQRIDGKRGAYLYESREALPLIYNGSNLEAARAEQARSQAALNRVREETLRKQRIPLDLVTSILDQTLQAMVATLKAAKGRVLTMELINDILADFRAMPAKLRW